MPTYTETRPVCVMDTECLPGYWSIGFRSVEDGRTKVFELFDGNPLDKKGIAKVFRLWTVVGFNSQKYDIPMIMLAMSGASNEELKQASNELIQFGVPHWVFMERHGLSVPDFVDHIDLMQVSPGAPQMPSLKLYAGRLHSRKMQELPFEHDTWVGEVERQVLRAYHGNDMDVTLDLRNDLKAQIALRTVMSEQYGVDLRSKSDAQIAEAVIKIEIERRLGHRVYKPEIKGSSFKYKVPAYVEFQTPQLQEALSYIRSAEIVVKHDGKLDAPARLKKLNVGLNGTRYQMGLGGLHSQESKVSHYSDDEIVLKDRDVTSYYPSSILLQGMFPKHLGSVFLTVYGDIYKRRLAAKASGDKVTAETLKIVLNGTYGKLGSPYSIFFSPDLMIQVTLTGQLAILMLIERLELAGIHVISANTDGIVSKVPAALDATFKAIFDEWSADTGYETEETEYISIHSQSINSYLAFYRKADGSIGVKRKGPFAESGAGLSGASGQKKNPDMDVCNEAVIDFLKHGTPIEETIEWCTDPRQFLTVRRVGKGAVRGKPVDDGDDEDTDEDDQGDDHSDKAGAVDQEGNYIGKAIRWYCSKNVSGGFKYANNGNAVPKSIGARLMMTLLPYVPNDIDYDYYIREAYAILQDLGVKVDDPALRGRTGQLIARLPDQKTFHIVEASTGYALCGKGRTSIRDTWVEQEGAPLGRAMCSKCKKEDEL